MTHLVASVNLLLGDRPLDEIHITQTTEQAFVVSFDIPLWQRRMKATGQVGIEFIASGKHVSSIGVSLLNYTLATGRMWSVIFFSIDSSSSTATSRKSRKAMNTWHVMISLLESSTPTYFGSQLIVDAVPPLNPELNQAPGPWGARSTELPPLCKEQFQSGSSKYDYNYDGEAYSRLARGDNVFTPPERDKYHIPSSPACPPQTDPLWGSPSSPLPSTETPPPISIHLGCGDRKLGRRTDSGESSSTHLNTIVSLLRH